MKPDLVFVCGDCGKQVAKWMGRCPACGEWNTIVETQAPPRRSSTIHRVAVPDENSGAIRPISEIRPDTQHRLKTGFQELDRVLGGGIVRQSVILVGGDPGIGKSTLLMQALGTMARVGERVLYVSGEESADQLKLRAERLQVQSDRFLILTENQLEPILEQLDRAESSVLVIDSVQSIYTRSVENAPGSISQVRHVAAAVVDAVKRGSAGCFIVGHVTKGGDLAGPKLLEHMVDTVLYFEGDRSHPYRILRAVKNRFGSVSEIGVFEMGDLGLAEVANPSELFLSERPKKASGSVITALVEGSRPILAEIQALVTGPVPGQGRRTCLGIDSQRLALMIAVLEKKLGLMLGDQDIFVNAVGGVRALEPAADLAVAAALLSSFMDKVVPAGMVVFGEVGLAGEVRRVSRAAARINEATRLGFGRLIVPQSNAEPTLPSDQVTVVGISHVSELSSLVLEV